MKYSLIIPYTIPVLSPSARKVWVEIAVNPDDDETMKSPSARKVWVEISWCSQNGQKPTESPSARKVWVEIALIIDVQLDETVTFREEGVG